LQPQDKFPETIQAAFQHFTLLAEIGLYLQPSSLCPLSLLNGALFNRSLHNTTGTKGELRFRFPLFFALLNVWLVIAYSCSR
jgi:hypothetical protein